MKHKVGDKVKIRKDLKTNIDYGTTVAVEEMCTFAGDSATIDEVDTEEEYYFIKEDDGYFCWTDDMFEDAVTNADKIRNMKDEELADFLKETVISCRENLFLCRECNKYGKCSTALKDCTNFITWLQSTKK